MKTIIAIFLTIALLVSSLLASVGLSTKYVMRPYEYFERFVRVFDNMPLDNNEKPQLWNTEKPEYYDLGLKLPVWNSVTIDGITEVPSALSLFVNRSMIYTGAVVKESLSIIPKIGLNAKMMVSYYLGPIPQFFVYVAKTIRGFFEIKDYATALTLAVIPLDWTEIQNDDVELCLPWLGALTSIPLEIYYNNNIGDEDTEGDVGGDMDGDNGEGNTGNSDNVGSGDDFTLDEYDPNASPDPGFEIPDPGTGEGGGNDVGIT